MTLSTIIARYAPAYGTRRHVPEVARTISGPSNALNSPPASTHEIAFGLKDSDAVSAAANRKKPCAA